MRRRADTLRRFQRDAADAWLFARVLLFTIVTPVFFRLRLPLVRRVLAGHRARSATDPALAARVVACVQSVQRIGPPLVRPGCLTRGTALYWFLRRAGQEVDLCFGAGFLEGRFEGHCWLEAGGAPYLEGRDPGAHFAEVFRVPSRGGVGTA